jgi:hypothetical protein
MGIKTQEHFVILENPAVKSLLGQTAEEFAETGVRSIERQTYKTAIEDWGNSYLKLKSGTGPTFDEMVEAGRKKALIDGVTEVLDEGQALSYLAKKTGTIGLTDFANQILKVNSKPLSTLTKLDANVYVKNVVKKIEDVSLDSQNILKSKTTLESLNNLIDLNKTISQENKGAIKDTISKQLQTIKSLEDDLITTPKSNEIKDFDKLLSPTKISSSEPKVSVKESLKSNTFGGKKLAQKVRSSLASGDQSKVKTSTLDETFEGSNIFTTGKGLDGLDPEIRELINSNKPNFFSELESGKYKNLVDENGNWDQINMLDTNIGDREVFFKDFAKLKGFDPENMTQKQIDEVIGLLEKEPNENIKKMILSDKEKYITNSLRNSERGEVVVNSFKNEIQTGKLKNIFDVVWEPKTYGNALDKSGVDMILKNKQTGKYVLVQFKSVGDIKVGESSVYKYTGVKNNLNFYLPSGINIKNGLAGVMDGKGNWVLFPPQTGFNVQVVQKANKKLGIPGIKDYSPRMTVDGKPVKEFRKTGGYSHVDISDKPGDEFWTNIDLSNYENINLPKVNIEPEL